MAKLFVILASDVPTAVIFRRGPSHWYHIIRWNTLRDEFEHGAWIKGRIYEESCDLSPDGKLLLYSVLQGSRGRTDFTHCWTAISRLPWLEALSLWPMGTTYGGGGRFIDNQSVVLREVGHIHAGEPHPDFPLNGIQVVNGEAPCHRSSQAVPGADWSGFDHVDRLVFTRSGQLFHRDKTEDRLLADFTDLTPNPEPAPEWATRPL